MSDEKTAAKTATSPLNGAVIPLGAHPGNTGGKKGRSGRKKEAIRAALRNITAGNIEVMQRIAAGLPVKQALKGPEGILIPAEVPPTLDQQLKAHQICLQYGIGTQQETEHSGEVGSYVIEVPAKEPSAAAWSARNKPRV